MLLFMITMGSHWFVVNEHNNDSETFMFLFVNGVGRRSGRISGFEIQPTNLYILEVAQHLMI